jgi:hypothetical protein
MKLLALSATAACVTAFTAPKSIQIAQPAVRPSRTTAYARAAAAPAARTAIILGSTRRGPDGKIYIGEPEPMEVIEDLLGGLLGGLDRAADRIFGPVPQLIPIPIPVEDEREQANKRPDSGM